MIQAGEKNADVRFETGTLLSSGVKLTYRRFGRGQSGNPPILLLHGLLYFSYDWIGIAEVLSMGHDVVAIDQRGFGDSDWSAEQAYAVNDFVNDINNTLSHLQWEKCLLVGHSMGGRIALAAAQALKEKVAGLVVLDAPATNSAHGARRIGDQLAGTPEFFKNLEQVLRYFPATPWGDPNDPARQIRFKEYMVQTPRGLRVKRDPYFHRLFFRMKAKWPYHSYEGNSWPVGQEFDYWMALRDIVCPTTLVSGVGVGDITSPEMVQQLDEFLLKNNLPHKHAVEIAHHNLPGRHADVVIKEIQKIVPRIKQGEINAHR